MANVSANNYLFLNRDGGWPHFHRLGLEATDDGTLQLSSVPLLLTPLPDAVRNATMPDGPAGVTVDQNGTVYFTQPDGNALNVIEGCGGVLGNSSVGVGLGARGAEARHGTAGPVGARLRTLLARALSTGPIATATPPSPRSSGRTSHPALPTSAPKARVTRFPLPDLTAPATGPR